jgi:hypothetical protein
VWSVKNTAKSCTKSVLKKEMQKVCNPKRSKSANDLVMKHTCKTMCGKACSDKPRGCVEGEGGGEPAWVGQPHLLMNFRD